MAEINLLKNELQDSRFALFKIKGLMPLYVMLGILGFEILVYGGALAYQKKVEADGRNWERQGAAVALEIEGKNADRQVAVSFQRRLNNIQVILDRHVFWTAAFDELAKYSLKTVTLQTLEADQVAGTFMITAAAPSYTEIGKYLQGLRQSPNILEIELKNSGQSQSGAAGYDFGAEIRFNTKLLQKP